MEKRMSKDTKISMTTMAVAMCMGLHATHMFVPPTPGPLTVAGILSADLGYVILFGALVSIPVMLVAYFGSVWMGKKYYYLPENVVDVPENQKLPSLLMAFLPILTPIVLMLFKTIGEMCGLQGVVMNVIAVLDTPAVALLVGQIIALVGYHQIFPEDTKAWGFDGVFSLFPIQNVIAPYFWMRFASLREWKKHKPEWLIHPLRAGTHKCRLRQTALAGSE
ncbi:MAG: GntP family permease [Faecousia sp.]